MSLVGLIVGFGWLVLSISTKSLSISRFTQPSITGRLTPMMSAASEALTPSV